MIKLLNLCGKDKYKDADAIEGVIKYIAKEGDKEKAPYTYGVVCSGMYETAIKDFNRIHSLFCKNPLTKIRHFVIAPANAYSPELLVEWMVQLGDMFDSSCLGNAYQMYFAVHVDRPIPHIHFALNPISYDTGVGFYCDEKMIDHMLEAITEVTEQEVQYAIKYK